MIGCNRGLHSWTHKDIIHLSHVHFKTNLDMQQMANATFSRGCKTVKKVEKTDIKPAGDGMKRLCQLFDFKICENSVNASKLMVANGFTIDQVPAHLIKQIHVWETALPNLTFMELLIHLPSLHDMDLLEKHPEFLKSFIGAITNAQLIASAKIYPIQIFYRLRLYQKMQRYAEPIKEKYHHNKVLPRNLDHSHKISKALISALNVSMHHVPKIGSRIFLTIDIKRSSFKKPILGARNVLCIEACLVLALSLMKKEKVTVMMFTEKENVLAEVPLTRDMTFDKALNVCKSMEIDRSLQNMGLPFTVAKEKKMKVDLFITMVDSIARSCQSGEAPITELDNYKAAVTLKKTKCAFINLTRRRQDINTNVANKSSFIELHGFDSSTTKILEHYAKGTFT